MRWSFAKFPSLSEIQTLSHNLLVRKTSNHPIVIGMPKNLPPGTFKWFQAVLPSQNQLCLCVYLRNKYGYQIGSAMVKYEMLWTGSIIAPGVQIYKFEEDQMSSFWDMTCYDSIIGISLIFLSKVKLLFEVKLFQW